MEQWARTELPHLLTVTEAMAFIGGYKDRKSFLRTTRKKGLPRIRINARVFRFDRLAIETWLKRRSI